MTPIRIAVVGAGHLGSIHARLACALRGVELTAIVDPYDSRARQVATDCGVAHAHDLREVLDSIDAAIVATPTVLHHEVGNQLLRQGKHVLMEKPLAATFEDADSLVRTAEQNGCILQVGHVERFNPVFSQLEGCLENPKYVEARRTSGFTFRSMDIGVVMDLMIHDIELVLRLVPGELTSVQAMGAVLFGGHEDIVQARLEFSEGCVVNLTASRASAEPERTMSVFCESVQASMDFTTRQAQLIWPRHDIRNQSFAADQVPPGDRAAVRDNLFSTLLRRELLEFGECNPIAEEHADFVSAIQSGSQPRVTGLHARNAVAVAERICRAVEKHEWDGAGGRRTGPHGLRPRTIPFPSREETSPARRRAG